MKIAECRRDVCLLVTSASGSVGLGNRDTSAWRFFNRAFAAAGAISAMMTTALATLNCGGDGDGGCSDGGGVSEGDGLDDDDGLEVPIATMEATMTMTK